MKGLYYTLGTLVLVAVVVALSMAFISSLQFVFASVSQGSEYNSTQVTSATASSTATTQVKSYAGSLGSIVVTDTGDTFSGYPSLVVYDATSTMATATAKVLAKFSTSTMNLGNYQFDTAFSYGLKLEVPAGFDGVYTVTYR